MKMGEDVVETWWKHGETLRKHGEIPASIDIWELSGQKYSISLMSIAPTGASCQVALEPSKVSAFARHV